MKFYRNNNNAYGEPGPHEAEDEYDLADQYEDLFDTWAEEEDEKGHDDRIGTIVERLRKEFIEGLEEVVPG